MLLVLSLLQAVTDVLPCSAGSLWRAAACSLLALLCKETGVMALVIVAVWSFCLPSAKQVTSWQTAAKYCLVVSVSCLAVWHNL